MRGPSWVLPYAAFLLLVGTGYLAILPPFEGFDEFAHYSSLRQVAQTAALPVFGASYIDEAVVRYRGPMPYGSGAPPFDPLLGAKSYPEFFESATDRKNYLRDYREPGIRPAFLASGILNWEAQQPPLYYVIMTPVVWATDRAPLVTQLFVLRLVSYLLAIAGVLFGLAATRKDERLRLPGALGFVCYPLLLPQFVPEFARIGNDSLCLFLLGWLMYLQIDSKEGPRPRWKPWLVGVILGLGMLTKAFFLPVTLAVVVWLESGRWQSGNGASGIRQTERRDVAAILITSVVVGGWWYVGRFLTFGVVTDATDAMRLAQGGGLLGGLNKHFSFAAILRGWAAIPVSWTWAGTWSLAHLPTYLHLPLVLLALWTVSEFVVRVRRRSLRDINWLTVLMTLGICAGLMLRTLQAIAAGGNGNTPGWYQHILMPWVALALGIGISAILRRRFTRVLFVVMTGYAVFFHAIAIWSEIALFSGCATKGADKLFHFSTPMYCLDQFSLVVDRLGTLAWPGLAVCAFCGAVACLPWLGSISRRQALFQD
jgi:hypothetical protein